MIDLSKARGRPHGRTNGGAEIAPILHLRRPPTLVRARPSVRIGRPPLAGHRTTPTKHARGGGPSFPRGHPPGGRLLAMGSRVPCGRTSVTAPHRASNGQGPAGRWTLLPRPRLASLAGLLSSVAILPPAACPPDKTLACNGMAPGRVCSGTRARRPRPRPTGPSAQRRSEWLLGRPNPKGPRAPPRPTRRHSSPDLEDRKATNLAVRARVERCVKAHWGPRPATTMVVRRRRKSRLWIDVRRFLSSCDRPPSFEASSIGTRLELREVAPPKGRPRARCVCPYALPIVVSDVPPEVGDMHLFDLDAISWPAGDDGPKQVAAATWSPEPQAGCRQATGTFVAAVPNL